MINKILPCPFCGSEVSLTELKLVEDGKSFYVKCYACKMKPDTGLKLTADDAIEVWNTRAPSKDRELLIELSLPGPSNSDLVENSQLLFHSRYGSLGNFMRGEMKERTKIALKIRNYLEENP